MINVSIVTYNVDKDQLLTALNCVLKYQEVNRVYLIDNSPTEHSRFAEAIDARIFYIHNKNTGYGSAHNIGIEHSFADKVDYHLVMNADIEFDENVLPTLVAYAQDHKNVAYIIPKVLYPNGDLQKICKLLPTPMDLIGRRFFSFTKWAKKANEKYLLSGYDYTQVINAPCLSGCFMFLRVSTMKQHYLQFDDRYFMYCEDYDLIRRIHRYGETICLPSITIIHNHEQASYKSLKMTLHHIISACKYFFKFGWFFDSERKKWNKEVVDELKQLKK